MAGHYLKITEKMSCTHFDQGVLYNCRSKEDFMIRYSCECMMCRHKWVSRFGNQPKICPKCKSQMISLAAMQEERTKKNGTKP